MSHSYFGTICHSVEQQAPRYTSQINIHRTCQISNSLLFYRTCFLNSIHHALVIVYMLILFKYTESQYYKLYFISSLSNRVSLHVNPKELSH